MEYSYEYTYEYPVNSGGSDAVFAAVMAIYLIVFVVALIFLIVDYIFHSIGMYTIAKRMGKSYPWLAFIPFARDYLHGELAEEIVLKNKSIKNPGIWKLVMPIISGVIFSVFYIVFLGAVGFSAFLEVGAQHSQNPSVGAGTILTILVIILIWTIVTVLYEAVHKVISVLIDFQIFRRFTSRNMAVAHGVLSVIVPFYEAFCLFFMRNKPFNPGMEPQLTPPPVPPVYPGPGPMPGPVPPTEPQQGPAGPQMPGNEQAPAGDPQSQPEAPQPAAPQPQEVPPQAPGNIPTAEESSGENKPE